MVQHLFYEVITPYFVGTVASNYRHNGLDLWLENIVNVVVVYRSWRKFVPFTTSVGVSN